MSDAALDGARGSSRPQWRDPAAPGLPGIASLTGLARQALASGGVRFLVAGGFASLLNWLVRFPLSRLAPFEVAVGLAYGVGMLAGFGLYRSWVFPGSTLPLRSQIARFVAVNAAGLLVVVFGAALLVAAIGWTGLLAPPAAEALAHGLAILGGAIVNFLGHRAVTFARRVVRRV